MDEAVREVIGRFDDEIQRLFTRVRGLALESAPSGARECLWARMPSYYAGERFVRILPFRDHLNVEAKAMPLHAAELSGYRLTPKGMLQLRLGQSVPEQALRAVFSETLGE